MQSVHCRCFLFLPKAHKANPLPTCERSGFLFTHGSVDLCAMTDGGFSKGDLDSLSRASAELSNAPIYIRDEAIMSPLQFRAAARKLVAQHKCKLLIVDYVQLMEPSNRTDSRERQVAECSRTIKTTAMELGIPIIVLAQLNDDGRSREIRAIEQDSNIFAVIEEQDGQHYLNLKYTRSCPRTRIPLTFRPEFTRFEEADAYNRATIGRFEEAKGKGRRPAASTSVASPPNKIQTPPHPPEFPTAGGARFPQESLPRRLRY